MQSMNREVLLMQILQRIKPYKNVEPTETIKRIRKLLDDNDIFVIENGHRKDPVTNVCSCRIILGDDGLRELNIGSNGKGMTTKYALASAYAEFMERLQNGALLWKVEKKSNLLPDAFFVSRNTLQDNATQLLKLAYGSSKKVKCIAELYARTEQNPLVVCFTEYGTNNSIQLPVGLLNELTGSNGMAAGNTLLEAIIQGLSEIFERAALLDIFLKRHTPPEISEQWYEGTSVLQRLRTLKKYGINYKILDCSLGKRLPVIGLLIEKNNSYHVHFGADPSPITALERCLTETFQGRGLENLPLFLPLHETNDRKELLENTRREFTDSTGQVPSWVIYGESSWNFSGFEHPVSTSDESDIAYYLDILSSLNKKLYVKDTGFLGFPSVRLYVPGLTEKNCPSIDDFQLKRFPEELSALLLQIPTLNDEQYRKLAKGIQDWLNDYPSANSYKTSFDSILLSEIKNTFPAGLFPGRMWDAYLLVSAIYYRGGMGKNGLRWLEMYLDNNNITGKQAEMLKIRLKSNGLTFLITEWPQCPSCDVCHAKKLCYKDEVERFQKQLTNRMNIV